MILLIVLFTLPFMALFWAIITDSLAYRLYDPKKFNPILKEYTGNRSMQILRALATGEIKPSDIRHYYNSGKGGSLSYTREEYVLIGLIADKCECDIIKKDSGCNYSMLSERKLNIEHGKAVITEYWAAA